MKKAGLIFIAIYYLLGNLILPMGDFSTIAEIPAMYQHCKVTEDKDLTAFDFITDHLVNIDGLFDDHAHGDPQKPHTPFPFHYQFTNIFLPTQFVAAPASSVNFISKENIYTDDFISDGCTSQLLRPPIV